MRSGSGDLRDEGGEWPLGGLQQGGWGIAKLGPKGEERVTTVLVVTEGAGAVGPGERGRQR